MKVLFFLHRIGPYHHARFEAAAAKMNLIAVETRPASDEYSWKFKPGGEYVVEQFPVSEDREKGIRGTLLHQKIQELIKKYQPDVIVNTGWADPEYNAVVIHASKQMIPLVVISDSKKDAVARKFYIEWMKRFVVKAYSAALVAGTESADYIISLGFPGNAVFKPWDVVDNELFHRANTSRDVPFLNRQFFCIARFVLKKNLVRLIDAYAGYLKDGGTRRLVLIGGGDLEGSLRAQIGNLGIASMIDLRGFVQQEEVLQHFSETFALILPSITDEWGLAVNEAMAFGLPILVSNKCGCTIDLVEGNGNGIIFDPLNVQTITESMKQMDAVSETRWIEMGKASFKIINKWGLPEFAEGLQSACTHALNSPSRRPLVMLHKLLSR